MEIVHNYNGMLQVQAPSTFYKHPKRRIQLRASLQITYQNLDEYLLKKNRSHNGRGRASLAPSSIMNFELGTKEIDKLVHLKIKTNK